MLPHGTCCISSQAPGTYFHSLPPIMIGFARPLFFSTRSNASYNDVCSPIKSEYPVVVGGLFLKKDLSVYVDTKITRQHLLDTAVS